MGRVTTKGQVTIPKDIRERFGIKPGDEVVFEETEDGVVIQKKVDEDRFRKWQGVAGSDESVEERMRALRGDRP